MKEVIKISVGVVIATLLLMIGFIVSIAGCLALKNYVFSYYNDSECEAYVANELVYEGKCHYLNVGCIGENGNTKTLKIYSDKIGLRVKDYYVSEDIIITKTVDLND